MGNKTLREMLNESKFFINASHSEKDNIIDYIEGKTTELHITTNIGKIDYYILWYLEQMLKIKDQGQALRLGYVLAHIDFKTFFNLTKWDTDIYKLCFEMGLEPEFVAENVGNIRKEQFKTWEFPIFRAVYCELRDYREKGNKSLIGQAIYYYGDAFKALMNQYNEEKIEDLPVLLYMQAVMAQVCEGEAAEEALKILEQNIKQQYTKVHKTEDPLQLMIFAINVFMYDKSNILKQILGEQIKQMGPEQCEKQMRIVFGDQMQKVLSGLFEDLNISNVIKVKYYAGKMIEEDLKCYGELYNDKLEMIYKDEPKALHQAYEESKKEAGPKVFLLFAFLRKHEDNFDEPEFSQIESKLMAYYNKFASKKQIYIHDRIVYQALAMLYEVSDRARQMIKKTMEKMQFINMIINVKIAISLYCKVAQDNILVELNQYLPTQLLLKQAILKEEGLDRKVIAEFAKSHLEDAEVLIKTAIKEGKEDVISYVKAFYTEDIGMSDKVLISAFDHRLKKVIYFMEEWVANKETELRPEIELLEKTTKNKSTKEAISRLKNKWDREKYTKKLEAFTKVSEVAKYLEEIYTPEKDKSLPYRELLDYSQIKDKDGEMVPPILVNYYLAEYMFIKEVEILQPCEIVKRYINERDFKSAVTRLYNRWLEDGADTKKKNIVVIYALIANDSEIAALKKQIDTWTENARGVLAAFAVTAMALNGSSMALMLTDSISRKYKNKQVKGAAAEAMDYVSKVRNIPREILEDRIIPNLGFDKNREMVLSYGTKNFKAKLTPQLEVTLFDEEKKKVIKSLPKPNQNDDEEKALAAKDVLKDIKKQIKAVIGTQKQRLFKAIVSGRSWSRASWEEVFIDNPIMNSFAISLIWSEYDEEGNLLGHFRYMEDGSFNTVDEEEYVIHDNSLIKLVHPMDLDEKEKENWKQQLSDYEITQSVTQLDMPIYKLTDEEMKEAMYTKDKGERVYFGKVLGAMEKFDWKKTDALDAGCFEGYYYQDETYNIKVLLRLEEAFMGMAPMETVTIQELIFCKPETNIEYYWDESSQKDKIIPLKEVPEKVLNLALTVLRTLNPKEEE